jgi:hypothetical protein
VFYYFFFCTKTNDKAELTRILSLFGWGHSFYRVIRYTPWQVEGAVGLKFART